MGAIGGMIDFIQIQIQIQIQDFTFVHRVLPVIEFEVVRIEVFLEVRNFFADLDKLDEEFEFAHLGQLFEVVHALEVLDDCVDVH
eukprot:CAMPEP_0116897858 /NCGR_PEP_ID=MMETSP0467-20121206/6721_1 /TAXON_ID=283647 /ORGANISM="Mesodinium pulex, Strain SPMC105" /LENGTH=84 /DNA_ID=CAMNT_0004569687 /DNA_START=309 /DNA_END=563 /DNA_ORIENTATION=-